MAGIVVSGLLLLFGFVAFDDLTYVEILLILLVGIGVQIIQYLTGLNGSLSDIRRFTEYIRNSTPDWKEHLERMADPQRQRDENLARWRAQHDRNPKPSRWNPFNRQRS